MNLLEIFLVSIQTLTVNKLRTSLAVLGIVIGIGSVIALVSLGQATQKSIQDQIQSLGSNLLTIMPASVRNGSVRTAMGGATSLTLSDAEKIEESVNITTIETVSPELNQHAQVTTPSQNTNTQIIGVTPAYTTVHKVEIQSGVFISDRDVEGTAKVAVLGPQVVSDLFTQQENPIGQTIRINNQSLTVIGITTQKGGSGFQNQDDVIYVPLTTAQKVLFGSKYLSSIALEAKSPESMTQAQNEVGYFLLSLHKIKDPAQADFSIFSQEDILQTASSTTGIFTSLLSGIAAISLLVGGIGIMNIMLVTVTERTREIGLRKALGAKKHLITTQFLVESVILTFSGGSIGIVLGIIASLIISNISNLPFVLSFTSILLACSVSTIIGVVFGWYPAKKAASLQPIEALRYE